MPARQTLPIQTLTEGDILGWSWLYPPYRWQFSARALEPTKAIAFDAARLRGRCEADHELGYQLMKRFAYVMTQTAPGDAASIAGRLCGRTGLIDDSQLQIDDWQ